MGFQLPPELEKKCLALAGKSGTIATGILPDRTQELVRKSLEGPDLKFGNRPVLRDGVYFQSTAEANRYWVLKYDLRKGKISALDTQVTFEFVVNGVKLPQTYRADFVYCRDGKLVVEDVKGVKTDLYQLKKSLMLACHGIEILETA